MNAIWPKTAIITAAMEMLGGGKVRNCLQSISQPTTSAVDTHSFFNLDPDPSLNFVNELPYESFMQLKKTKKMAQKI